MAIYRPFKTTVILRELWAVSSLVFKQACYQCYPASSALQSALTDDPHTAAASLTPVLILGLKVTVFVFLTGS